MLAKNIDIEEFDIIHTAVDYSSIPAFKRPNIFQRAWARILSKTTEIPQSLMALQLGTVLECLKKKKPSKVVELINSELHIWCTNKQKVPLWKVYNEFLREMSGLLGSTSARIRQDGYDKAVWSNLLAENPIDSCMWIIDELSDKWRLPYSEILKQPFADCLMALRIKKVRSEFEDRKIRSKENIKKK